MVAALQDMWDASGEGPRASSTMRTWCRARAKAVTLLCPEALRKVFIRKVVSDTGLEGQGGIGQVEMMGRLILRQGTISVNTEERPCIMSQNLRGSVLNDRECWGGEWRGEGHPLLFFFPYIPSWLTLHLLKVFAQMTPWHSCVKVQGPSPCTAGHLCYSQYLLSKTI